MVKKTAEEIASRGQHSWTLDEDQSRKIIKRGLELGVNFFDTAIAYQSGTSEPYVPHPLAGVMAQNKPANANEKHVWSTGDQKISEE